MRKVLDVTTCRRVAVSVDESKFTDEFMDEFRKSFYPFHSIDAHVRHLATLASDGIIHDYDEDQFVEGYGVLSKMGIKIEFLYDDTDIEEVKDDG